MDKLFKLLFGDIIRTFITLLISLLVISPLCILFILIPLWENGSLWVSDQVLIAAAVLWMALFCIGIIGLVLLIFTRQKKWLDSLFLPLGLTGKSYMLNGREYNGLVNGRKVRIRFFRGPTLKIAIQTNLKTRMGITESCQPGPLLAHYFNKKPVPLSQEWQQPISVYGSDEAWIREILQSSDTAAPIQRLLKAGDSWSLIRHIVLSPGTLTLTVYRTTNPLETNLSAGEVRVWIFDLITLVRIFESYPSPVITAEKNWAEKMDESGQSTRFGFIILFLIFGIGALGIVIIIWFLVMFFE